MRRFLSVALAIAFALSLTATADASAQAALMVGGGATVPAGDYSNYAKTGWMGFAGVLVPVGDQGLAVGAEGFYGSNSHDTTGDKTNLAGGMALASYSFSEADAAGPFLWGGLGYMSHSFKSEQFPSTEGSESGLTTGLGAGLGFPLGGASGFVVGGYVKGFGDVKETSFFSVSAGVQFAVGGSS